MNYLIQRGKARQQAINVPDGFPELLSDITREVLRCQPTKECLCQFIIDYLHSLIVTREKAMVAKSILDRALRQVDSIISDLCVCELSQEKSEMMASVMEECFRNFLEKRRCEMRRGKEAIKFADIDMLSELLEKCKFSEEELDSSRPAIESAYKRFVDAYMAAATESQGTELLYQYFRDRELKRIDEMMRNQAAITIQAAFRGYIVRRTMALHVCTCTCMMDDEEDEETKRQDAAARIIQRFFRWVMARQAIKPIDDPCVDKETPPSKDDGSSPPTLAVESAAEVAPAAAESAAAVGAEASGEAAADEAEPAAAVAEEAAPAAAAAATEEAAPAAAEPAAAEAPAEAAPEAAAEAPPEAAAPAAAEEAAAPAAAEEPAPAAPAEEPAPAPPAEEAPPAAEAEPPAAEAPAE
ncbi:CG10014 [Drosophila busckii]|uniref:CG10014 n=1 Tax=Drosophila busckii TaxID=30019 RepID=A0A0M5JC57_DROBS|nr:translation initiation factor IF-2 [Drosophila busckii]ALC45794.1 CG10014 [Drosophila busckii]